MYNRLSEMQQLSGFFEPIYKASN